MQENYKVSKYPSRNIKTETYDVDEISFTKHYYDAKDAYVKELIKEKDGVKEVKHFTSMGVASKLEYFKDDKRDGIETKYFIPKANKSVKSTKTYSDGKLHGESLTYNSSDEIIKQELFANGKLIVKYLRDDSESRDITSIVIVDKDMLENLPKIEYDKLQESITNTPDLFSE